MSVDKSSLLAKLKGGTRNVKTVKFPGTDINVVLRILSNQEIQDAVFAAEKLFDLAKLEVKGSSLDAYEDERSTQILFRALRDPEDPTKSFSATVAELRNLVSRAEKDVLISLYGEFERECSPGFSGMSNEEFEEIWEAVKKNAQILSSISDLSTLKGLLLYLASLQANSRTDSGSTSSD